jgi:hypothetical protein
MIFHAILELYELVSACQMAANAVKYWCGQVASHTRDRVAGACG